MICSCTQVHRSLLGIPRNRITAYKQDSRSNKRSSSFFTLNNHYINFFHHRNSIRVPTTQSLNPEDPSLLKGKTLALLRRERGKKGRKNAACASLYSFRIEGIRQTFSKGPPARGGTTYCIKYCKPFQWTKNLKANFNPTRSSRNLS